VVKVAILLQPLLRRVLVARVHHRPEDELEVLCLTLGADELVRGLEDGLIPGEDAQPVPPLLDFRVLRFRELVVRIDSCHYLWRHIAIIITQLVEEDELGERGVVAHVHVPVGRATATQLFIAAGEALRLRGNWSAEVLYDR